MLSGLKNIHFLGKAEHDKVPFFIKYFDICVIPYLITEYTKNVYPTKLNEYLAMGKPVLATDLPEIRKFNQENNNLVYVGRDEEEFIGYLSKVNGCDNNETLQKRLSVAKNNGWARRIEQMSGLIEESIDKKSGQAFDWKKAFLRLYASTRKKTLKLLFVAISLYIIVFYTPLFWLIASPLKISQAPQKADCIVVFAGGTGESGKAGQGYEERVGYAVELYKKGYASRVIFSSGYMFFFKEPVVMKALAVSLGVPQEAIILEDKASGTYQNVRFTRDILLSNGWNRILLVSSPYHMRRAALVFNKIAGNIKVSYTPLPNALFYSHPERDEHNRRVLKRINTQQIRGILHEYLGILYYWFKGYI
jgi:uncharacterized SAM-binding protein YcdF (DUF218 family)